MFKQIIKNIVTFYPGGVWAIENKNMALFSHLRKLLGLALAMLIIATSIQPVQAHLRYGEGRGDWMASEPSTTNEQGPLDAALYIAEESEWQVSRKGPSHRLSADEPFFVLIEVPLAALIPILRYVPPYRAPPADTSVFISPLKTGPPSP